MNQSQREIAKAERESLERSMHQQLTRYLRVRGLEWRSAFHPEGQLRFHPDRNWRFDFAEMTHQLAIEVNGGEHLARSGHNTATGSERDAEKFAEAAILGWTVLFFPGAMVRDGRAILLVERWFRARHEREMERFIDEGMAEK